MCSFLYQRRNGKNGFSFPYLSLHFLETEHVQSEREMFIQRINLILIRLQGSITVQTKFLHTPCILLQQINVSPFLLTELSIG
jgi:hypothetical protein